MEQSNPPSALSAIPCSLRNSASSSNPSSTPLTCKSFPSRPGRKQFATPQDETPNVSYGDDVYSKHPDTMRIFFQNIKGLTHSAACEDYKYCLHSLSNLQADIVGLTETNTPWLQAPHLQADFRQCIRRQFNLGKVVFGSPDEIADPIEPRDIYQAGGNLTLSLGSFVPMVLGSSSTILLDPRGLGRWSGMTLRGKNGKLLSLITGYRTCRGSIASSPLGSTFHREYTTLKSTMHAVQDPRKIFIDDLTQLLVQLRDQGHEILLMLDANSTLDDAQLSDMVTNCQLHDLHRNSPAPSTYMGAPNRRIDYIFGSLPVANAVRQQGSLSYYEGPLSDYRGLFVDLSVSALLGSLDITQTIPPLATRLLKSGNPELVEEYVNSMKTYYTAHDMVSRIDQLYESQSTMSRDAISRRLEQWDTDQGKVMKAAEASLKQKPQRIPWSPALRNAAILRRYWKIRLGDARDQTDHTARMLRLQSQIQQGEPTYKFPLWKIPLSLDDIRHNLTQSSRALRLIQRDATSLRHQTLFDLLAVYHADTDPSTSSESKRKAKIVQRTIDREHSVFWAVLAPSLLAVAPQPFCSMTMY